MVIITMCEKNTVAITNDPSGSREGQRRKKPGKPNHAHLCDMWRAEHRTPDTWQGLGTSTSSTSELTYKLETYILWACCQIYLPCPYPHVKKKMTLRSESTSHPLIRAEAEGSTKVTRKPLEKTCTISLTWESISMKSCSLQIPSSQMSWHRGI